MKKRANWGILLATFAILTFLIFSATANSETDAVDKAYSCLESQISSRPAYSLQEAIFGTLALGRNNNLTAVIQREKASDNCWPKSGCKIKDTAQVLLAYDRIGENTDNLEKWLLSRNGTANELAWYLEIDTEAQKPASCNVKYAGGEARIQIGENMKMSGSTGSCLTISSSKNLLRVRESCLDKTFDISCGEAFVSALLYQKNRGENVDCLDNGNVTCYVLGETHSAPSLGTTQEKINAQCFKTNNLCDYEGSLWAALALQQAGINTNSFVPYLVALAEDYPRYFPYSFLTFLVPDDELSYSKLIELRKQEQYWEISGSPYNRYYDTALGMLGLGTSASEDELAKTQNYLLSIQTKEGCWNNNNIRDTGIILWAGWKRGVTGSGISGDGTAASTLCTEAGFSCERMSECLAANGSVKDAFTCSGVSVCCSIAVPKQTCVSQNGRICSAQTQCDGSVFEASDGSCCLGACTTISFENECEQKQGICKATCDNNEEESIESCNSGSAICCMPKPSGGGSWLWVILIILIIIILLLIFFRRKLQLWWFSRRTGTITRPFTRPGAPPSAHMPMQRPFARQPILPSHRIPVRHPSPPAGKTNEFEDTLKKLREMSK